MAARTAGSCPKDVTLPGSGVGLALGRQIDRNG
jgi:hypothetical protein